MKAIKLKKSVAMLVSVFTIVALLVPFTPAVAEETDSAQLLYLPDRAGAYATLEASLEPDFGTFDFCPPCECPPDPPCENNICPHIPCACKSCPVKDRLTLVAKVVNETASTIQVDPKSIHFSEVPRCYLDENGGETCQLSDLQFNVDAVINKGIVPPHSTTVVAFGHSTLERSFLFMEGKLCQVQMRIGKTPNCTTPEKCFSYRPDLSATTYLPPKVPNGPSNYDVVRLIQDVAQKLDDNVNTVNANVQQGTNDVRADLKYLNNWLYPKIKDIWYAVVKWSENISRGNLAPKLQVINAVKKT